MNTSTPPFSQSLECLASWYCGSNLAPESLALRWSLAALLALLHLPSEPESIQASPEIEVVFLELCSEQARLEASAFHNEETLAILEEVRLKVNVQADLLFAGNFTAFKAFVPQSRMFRIFIAIALTQLEWIRDTEFVKSSFEQRLQHAPESPLYSMAQLVGAEVS